MTTKEEYARRADLWRRYAKMMAEEAVQSLPTSLSRIRQELLSFDAERQADYYERKANAKWWHFWVI